MRRQIISLLIVNSSDREEWLILEPEAESLALAPGDRISLRYVPQADREFDCAIEFHQEGSLVIHSLATVEAWRGDKRVS
jgi:hypothetical protein